MQNNQQEKQQQRGELSWKTLQPFFKNVGIPMWRKGNDQPVQWSFWLRSSTMSKATAHYFQENITKGRYLIKQHQVSEWQELNLKEYLELYSTGSNYTKSRYLAERVEFIRDRFVLFAKRVNKKMQAMLGENIIDSELQAFVRYFEIQKRFLISQEKYGYNKGYEKLFVSKEQLLNLQHKYLTQQNSPLDMEPTERIEKETIIDMTYRYVYFKTDWYGDLDTQYYVDISDHLLRNIVIFPDQYDITLLCLNLLLLSEGQLVIGLNLDFMLPDSLIYDRLRPSRTHAFTWIGYERVNEQMGVMSAMVPRRIPEVEMKEFTLADGTKAYEERLSSFSLEHYALMLNTFPLSLQTHQIDVEKDGPLDYNKFMPKERIKPFRYETFKICNNQRGFQSCYGQQDNYDHIAALCTMPSHSFNNFDSSAILTKDVIRGNKENLKTNAYRVTCKFKSRFHKEFKVIFPFQKQCYRRNEEDFWSWDEELATQENFQTFQTQSMPDQYVQEAFNSLQRGEELVCQRHLYSKEDETTGYADRYGTMDALQKFERGQRLGKVLQMLPIVKMALNSNQQRILNSSENLFILGRSGTGKTTTTVLRFFCQEAMYIAMRKQRRLMDYYSKAGFQKKYIETRKALPRLTADDVNEVSTMRMVFVTASPVLTNEVKQYYTSLKQQLAAHLVVLERTKEESKVSEEAKASAQEGEEVKGEENKEEIAADREKLIQFLEIREQEIIQAEQVEQQLALPERVASLRPQHFPVFLTVQRLVYMLDASLYNSFFTRRLDGRIVGMETSLGWHSEDRGVFMINQDYKQSDALKQQIQEFELSVLAGEKGDNFEDLGAGDVHMDMIADVGTEDNMQVKAAVIQTEYHYQEGSLDKQYRKKNHENWKTIADDKGKKKLRLTRKGVDEFPLCQEITMEIFEEKFMPRMQRFMSKSLSRKLSPTFIWTEIMSVIKGSIDQEITRNQSYLTRKQYLNYNQSKSLLSTKEKSTLYYIFLQYEQWKLNVRAFDFLDVVNHVLVQNFLYPRWYSTYNASGNSNRNGIPDYFDYLIIDEVQDLYPKTIKLLLQHAKYKVVFAGDTAQTIAKGVSTRISDMQDILSRKNILQSKSINLSINYRSQNSILQLANNVVKIIETIFPESIDKMSEEISERQGEKPYLIEPVGDELLCQFFFGKTVQETADASEDFSIIEDDDDAGNQEKGAAASNDRLRGGRVITPHFGASQVIIVRDQHVKEELPEFMKSMLCLTVYESKGLEFDDVILYNFFAMGEVKSAMWKLLGHIREEHSYRKELPDWIMDIGEEEEENFVEACVADAVSQYREQKKQEKLAMQVQMEEDAKRAAQDQDEEGKELNEFANAESVAAQEEQSVQEDEENKNEGEGSEFLEEEEEDPEEAKLVEQVRKAKQTEFIKIKYDEAIRKFERDQNPEHAQFIKEFNYSLVGHANEEPGEIQRRYQLLCTELKFLYVAITRPKLRLFIYDEDTEVRKPLEAIWMKLDAVQKITREDLLEQEEQRRQAAASAPQVNTVGSLGAAQCDPEKWKLQGLRFLKQKNYHQAIKCFNFAGSRELALRCKAFIAAQSAQQSQQKIDAEAWEFKHRSRHYSTKSGRKQKQFEMKQARLKTCRMFHQAGLAFEKANIQKFAASCYFTARSYSRAAELFKQLEQWSQVGECLMRIGKSRYREAASFFEKGELVLRAIECYEQIQEWELLLHCLNRNQDKFGEHERKSLVNKYVPIALNNIYQQYGMVERREDVPQGDQGNVGQKAEQKIAEKYKVSEAIAEEDFDEYGQELEFEDSEGSDEESKTEDGAANAENAEDTDSRQILAEQSEDEEDKDEGNHIMSNGFQLETIIKQSYKPDGEEEDEEEEQKDDASFEIIDSSEEDNNSKDGVQDQQEEQKDSNREGLIEKMKDLGDSFDHLSQYDPDDEFLQSNRSLSIIESIVAKEGRGTSNLSESSEFSIISAANVKSTISSILSEARGQAMQQINFIDEQDDDNYVQDVIAQKIIYYLSLWSDDMRHQLGELKRQGILHEVQKDATNETIDETDFIIQMDDVDQEFVNLILDTLEVYEFYHMSLMMCKRYNLSGRQGRYLVLMCSKYSNLNRNRIEFTKLVKNRNMMEQQRACSLLAHEAIHNVLCLIDTNYLKMKSFGQRLTDENSLGMQAYTTILNLGFWKKLVYILEKKISLHLCMKFFDFKNYLLIMKAFMTQEEKLHNKALLDVWTLKTQVKGFLLEKQKILTREVKKREIASLIGEFKEKSSDFVSAIQLNQKSMQSMLFVQEKIQEMFLLYEKLLESNERKAQFEAIFVEIDQTLSSAMRAFTGKSTDQNKFVGASMLFDLCFNIPVDYYQNRILRQVVAKLTDYNTAYQLLTQAYAKLENYQQITEFDPILDALYSVNLISPLENEDFTDPEMQNLFQFYADSYMLVSSNSSIINDVIHFQKLKIDCDVFAVGEAFYAKLKYQYFDQNTRLMSVSKKLTKKDTSKSQLSQWKQTDRHMAFVADMDAQFLFVPKAWIRYILMVKIAHIQSKLTLGDQRVFMNGRHFLTPDKFNQNRALITRLQMMNNKNVNSILRQAHSLTKAQSSAFWAKIRVIQNINYTAQKLLEALSTTKLLSLLRKAIRLEIDCTSNYLLFGDGLLPKGGYAKVDTLVPNAEFNRLIESGLMAWTEVCGKNCRLLGREKDLEQFLYRLLLSLGAFINAKHQLPFIELLRGVFKKETRKGPSADFVILRGVRPAIDCHTKIKNGQWMDAAQILLSLSSVKPVAGSEPLFDALTIDQKSELVEFASIIIFLLRFRQCFLPDYALSYVDPKTDFSALYGDEDQVDLLRKRSSLMRQRSSSKGEESKEPLKIIGKGRKVVDTPHQDYEMYDHEYYEEMTTYKQDYGGEEDDYDGEEESDQRMVIERNIEASHRVENPDGDHVQALYEKTLESLVDFLDTINNDELAFMYQEHQRKVYNLLMAVVVNDKQKSMRVSQLLGQGFNRLVRGPHDEYFDELGIPAEWSNSNHASTLSAATFEEQMLMFEEADIGLKWQWFTDLDHPDETATGLYVAKIDITAAQTPESQEAILENERQSQNFLVRQLALRQAAARQISRAFRRKLDEIKERQAETQRKAIGMLAIDRLAYRSKDGRNPERVDSIKAHARVSNIESLTQLSQIDVVAFIEKLQQVYAQVNYLQELMVVKAFSNSIEISKAINFMGQLSELHELFCSRARHFAQDQAQILNSFDLLDQGEDPITPQLNDLSAQLRRLETEINLWQIHVFEGHSSGFAIRKILESQTAVQQRLKLKWQRMKPTTKRQRLALFKARMVEKYQK